VKEETDHLAAIVDDFSDLQRPKKPVIQPEDLNRLLRDMVRRHRESGAKGVEWTEEYDESLTDVLLDRHQLQQVLTNADHQRPRRNAGGRNALGAGLSQRRRSEPLRVHLGRRHGRGYPGIGKPPRFFSLFTRRRKKGRAWLAICRRIVGEHDGRHHGAKRGEPGFHVHRDTSNHNHGCNQEER